MNPVHSIPATALRSRPRRVNRKRLALRHFATLVIAGPPVIAAILKAFGF